MKRSGSDYLPHFRERTPHRKYIDQLSRENFLKSIGIRDAVIRRLEIIGEAVKNISPELRDKYPGIPWRKIYFAPPQIELF